MATNLFNKAKSQGKEKKKNDDKTIVTITSPAFHLGLTRLIDIQKKMDELKAEADLLAGDLKTTGIEEFNKLYSKSKSYPGSFIIKATGSKGDAASYMFIPTDKYIKLGEERFNELVDKYGDDVAKEKTTYTMNPELVEKHGETISELIEKCKDIPKEDKEALIMASTAWEINKGTISKIPELFPGIAIDEVVEDIRPIFQVKNPKKEGEEA